MLDFFARTGKMALGSRLRRLSDRLTEQTASIYALYGNDLQPRWFPVFYTLADGEGKTISDIAHDIGHSHASVSQIVREMAARDYVLEQKGKDDARKNFVALTAKGTALFEAMHDQILDVAAAMETALKEANHDLYKAIQEWEFLLDQKDLLRRVQDERKKRIAASVTIIDYTPDYQEAFKSLNEHWISTYFKMEPSDYKSLDHPQEYILDQGGHIFMALLDGKPVGTVALIRLDERTQELAKMAVAPEAQGRNIGWLLGQAAIQKGRELGLHSIYLESNTILKPAISLYHKLGFQKISGPPSPYERCNIQMELIITTP